METNKIFQKDCIEGLKEMPEESVDCIITDPPYNASKSKITFEEKGYYAIDEEWDKTFDPKELIFQCERVLKPTGSMLIFCSHHLLGEYLNIATIKLQQIFHWIKTNPFPAIAKIYTPNVEYVLWFIKGNPYTFNRKGAQQNIIYTPILTGNERTEHPSQKPLKVLRLLVRNHSNEGDIVLDPFMGSGTTALACKHLNRQYIGFEISDKYCRIAEDRLKQQTLNGFALRNEVELPLSVIPSESR